MVGKFEGGEALVQINKLILEREHNSNNLEFSNIKFTLLENTFVYDFDSNRTVTREKLPYSGFNMIKIAVDNNRVIGFQEFLG